LSFSLSSRHEAGLPRTAARGRAASLLTGPPMMITLFQNVGQNIAVDFRDLLRRALAPHLAGLRTLKRTLKRQTPLVPHGFLPLAVACSLAVAVARVHELVRERGRVTALPRTRLRTTKLAYAKRDPTVR